MSYSGRKHPPAAMAGWVLLFTIQPPVSIPPVDVTASINGPFLRFPKNVMTRWDAGSTP